MVLLEEKQIQIILLFLMGTNLVFYFSNLSIGKKDILTFILLLLFIIEN